MTYDIDFFLNLCYADKNGGICRLSSRKVSERMVKMVKKSLSVFLPIIILMALVTSCGAGKSSNIYSFRENFTAQNAADEMGIGINLGNTFEAYISDDSNLCGFSQVVGDGKPLDYETCWGAIETTKEIIDGMRDAGFKTVRIPVFWGNGMSADSDFTINKGFADRVEQVVKWVLEDGMYCVINMHHYDERLIMFLDREDAVYAAGKVWGQVAERFKDYGDHLIFEGYNEYLGGVKEGTEQSDDYKFEYCNEMNQAFVDAVRATGGNNSERILIASGFNTNIDKTTSFRFKMPTDTAENKMMVSVHYIDNNMYWSKQIGSENWHNYIISQCDLLRDAFTMKGIPVFVGETTASYKGQMVDSAPYGSNEECIRELIRIANEEYGFKTVFWETHHDDGSAFYDRTTCKIPDSENAKTVKKYGE